MAHIVHPCCDTRSFQSVCPLWVLTVGIAVTLTGCAWRAADGTRNRVILGLGVVSTQEQAGVSATDLRALGLGTGRQGFLLGYGASHTVEIDPQRASNAVVAVRGRPFSLNVTNFVVPSEH